MLCIRNSGFFILFVSTVTAFNLTLLHTNDIHSRYRPINSRIQPCSKEEFEGNQCWGGASRRRTAVEEIRQREKNVLLLDAGDQYQGTVWFVVFQYKPIAEVMNMIGYDAMTLGNHEFDNGDAGALPFIDELEFPVVVSNIDTSNSILDGYVRKQVIQEMDGRKVGILGCVTVETPFLSNPDNVSFEPEVKALKKQIDDLTREEVNIVIVLSHSGIDMDRRICQQVPGVDVVIGGHTNTFLYTGEPPSLEQPLGPYPEVYRNFDEPCLVVSAYAFGKYLGRLNIDLDEDGEIQSWSGNPILLDNTYAPDPVMEQLLDAYEQQMQEEYTKVIGETHVSLNGMHTSCRAEECNIGNMMTDSAVAIFQPKTLEELPEHGWTHCSVGFLNGGSFRNYMKTEPGPITVRDVYTISPFTSEIVLIQIKGRDLLEAFEHSVRNFTTDNLHGKFLQVSGIRVTYDIRKPNGERVKSIYVLCSKCDMPKYVPLDPDEDYNVATKMYLFKGGDGYTMLENGKLLKGSGIIESENALIYFRNNNPVTQGIEGRITFVNSEDSNSS